MVALGDSIEHVVALVLENRSFDHLLGDLGRSGGLPLDGGTAAMSNRDINGRTVPIAPLVSNVTPDLPHDFDTVAVSLMDGNGGFVRADQLQRRKPTLADAARAMSFYPADTLPVTHALAREYAVCDRWFASVPGGTWPNRLFLVAGSSDGRVTNTKPALLYEMPSIFDRLKSDEWAIYNDQIPNVALLRPLAIEWAKGRLFRSHFRSTRSFEEECAAGALPAFSFIEPVYLGSAADDGHPPHDIMASEHLIGRVYSALRRSPLWSKSLLLILYDEHGGLFDHVPPPTALPSTGVGEYGFDFTAAGVRVPCLIVSPLVGRGSVWRPSDGSFVDHTSLVATVLRWKELEPLSARDAAAADVWAALGLPMARTDDGDTLARIQTWIDEQEQLIGRDLSDPLDPAMTADRSGREVAAMIVAAHGIPQAVDDAAVFRDMGAFRPREPVVIEPLGDVTLERALVELAAAILTLPPDLEPEAAEAGMLPS